MTTEDTMDDELARILENHNKQVADGKRGYPIGTQNYFTVNRIKNLLAPETNKAVVAEAKWWSNKTVWLLKAALDKDHAFDSHNKEMADRLKALTADREQA